MCHSFFVLHLYCKSIMQIKEQKGFQVLPKRWVVERTFAWLNGSRRLSKDYETSCCSAETMIMISHAATLLKRL